jgi:K+-sensing histidine kinase KdpD
MGRGRLRVYLGALRRRETYAMLAEGGAAGSGTDVVVGYVETWPGGDGGISVTSRSCPARGGVPRRNVREMDLDAVLATTRRRAGR